MSTKAYRISFLVVDLDEVGIEQIKHLLENQRMPNHCMPLRKVLRVDEADLGEWRDSHPLNFTGVPAEKVDSYFDPDGKT